MSQLKKFIFLALGVIALARLTYAGVVDISDTEFSNSGVRSASTSSDGSHTSTTSGVTCGDVTSSTEEGCNAALGISSGAIATACDGGLYTCFLPAQTRAANPECDSGAKTAAAECTAQGATAEACGDGSKYNCVCASNYTQTCDVASNQYPDPSEVCINSKGEKLIPDSSKCLVACRAEGNGFSLYDTRDEASSACIGVVSKCYSNAAGTFRWLCDQSCSTIANLEPYRSYQQSPGNCSEYNGEPTGITCGDGVNLCRCNSSAYMTNFDVKPTCGAEGERPLVDAPCTAENPLNANRTCVSDSNNDGICDSGIKYQSSCGYPDCSDTEMTMMNLVSCDTAGWHYNIGNGNITVTPISGNYYSVDNVCSNNNAASGIYNGGTETLHYCTIPNNATCTGASNIILNRVQVCSCSASYKYVPNNTTFSDTELTSLGLEKCDDGEVPLALASKDATTNDICIWNAQTSIKNQASSDSQNGKKNDIDESRFRYGNKCLRECEAWEVGTPEMSDTTCPSGQIEGSCAISNASHNILGVPLYYEHKYCTCPRDTTTGEHLYKDSCTDGKYLGGKTCSDNGTLRYQYCLKPCVSGDGAKYSPWDETSVNCGFEQNMGNLDDYEDPANDINLEDNFYACFENDKDVEPSVQCRCPSNYKTAEECATDNSKIGVGDVCELDNYTGVNNKYSDCALKCPLSEQATIVSQKENCQFEDADFSVKTTNAIECYEAEGNEDAKFQCLCPSGYQSKVEHCGGSYTATMLSCNATCQDCMEATIGIGEPCKFESKINGSENEQAYKYHNPLGWGSSCSYRQEEANDSLTIMAQASDCDYNDSEICYNDDSSQQFICKCTTSYQTLVEFCQGKEENCITDYVGIGTPCTYDVSGTEKLTKYASFGKKCPTDRPVFEAETSCAIGEVSGTVEACYEENNNGIIKYTCNCPDSFGTSCDTMGETRGGIACNFESYDPTKNKYEKCLPICQNTATTPVVSEASNCPLVDGSQAYTEEQCFNKYGDSEANYICRCPTGYGYKTLAEFCSGGVTDAGGREYTEEECLARFTGVGVACTYDGVGVNKYKEFSVICPTDRPILNTAEDCTNSSVPGQIDYYCYERHNPTQSRVVCKCPDSWVDVQGNSGGVVQCTDSEEPSGQTCNFDGPKNIKYEACYTRCDKLSSNGKGVTYLEEEDNYRHECTGLLGDGATLGVDGEGGACSRNNTLMYPCYCGNTYTERCLNSDNEVPAPNALACTINGTTYYESCANNDCSPESSTIAIIDDSDVATSADVLCQSQYGTGATGKRCGEDKVECSCNAREYSETCEYPYDKPDDASVKWCKYSSNSGLMSSGTKHYPLGSCKVKPVLAKCGKHILNSDGSQNNSYTIKVASTEGTCKSQYGSGVSAQLCEYEDNVNKRAYNCYYKDSDYVWNENNCPIRHVLGTDYVIKNGVKYYRTCDCHPAYKHHKYNCAGMLSGSACDQKVDDKKASDTTLAIVPDGTTLSFYPYCQCTADYNQVCDGERNVGVGEPCNGKYRACECKPDPLPENWADNYYGCPGGKKPTGVTKPNGCGGKYYQCSVTECTWQHTETCPAPLIGVDSCQDNEGNIGGYKSCKCPDGYVICPNGTVGEGEPCLLKGKYYYQESNCVEESKCVHGESLTCSGPLQIGVNPCKRNGITYFEYCVCASGYNKKCNGDNEVGVGDYCTLNETKFYAECANPSMTCTTEHKFSCDSNQTSYDPCVDSNNKVKYKCKCPTNYLKCEEKGMAAGADSCTDTNGTVYSACAVENSCTEFQLNSYKACREFQVGSGGSCLDVDGQTLYAKCEETSECRANGYQYTCQGYDQSIQGEACVDENGNKLYKQCKCPTGYVECTGKNNTKGETCVELYANGTSGPTLYSSCTCDASVYKYDCATDEDGGNLGVVKGNGKECTYIDAEGNSITKYETCSCNSAYKYLCTANGQFGNENDFCQSTPTSTKLYKSCSCREEFDKTCVDPENPGLTIPADANKACTPQNTGDDKTRYSSCTCGKQYQLQCNSKDQMPADENNFCINEYNTKLYKACDCPAHYLSECKPAGSNKGLTTPEGNTNTCIKQYYQNEELKTVTYYETCTCDSAYNKTCNEEGTTPELYIGMNDDYCEISTVDGTGSSITTKTYKQCICRNDFSECSQGTEALPIDQLTPGVDYCKEISANGNATIKYAPGVCMCNASQQQNILANDDYIETNLFDAQAQTIYASKGEVLIDGTRELNKTVLSSSNQSALERLFLQECGYQKNGIVKGDGCGRLYYKCRLNPSEYPYYNGNCEAPKVVTTGQTSGGWDGTFTMYKSCDCPDAWYSQEECTELSKKGTSSGGRRCQVSGTTYRDKPNFIACDEYHNGFDSDYGTPDPNTPALKIYGDSCIKEDGTEVRKYCECNMDVFYYYHTNVRPRMGCIDTGDDASSSDGLESRVNHHVYVCYFSSDAAKNLICPSCKKCNYYNVKSSYGYHVSKSYSW